MKKTTRASKSSSSKAKPVRASGKVSRATAKAPAARPPRAELRVGDEVWPLERDVLFRPDRFKYVRKLIKPEGCVFCTAAREPESFETLCVHKTEHSMIVTNKFPYNSGHLLILPRRHCGDMLELSTEEHRDLHDLIRSAMRALKDVYEPGGMNLGLNHGAVAGAGIPEHLHYHLIPRWSGDLNFFPLIAETKAVIEGLDQSWDRLRNWFRTSGRTR